MRTVIPRNPNSNLNRMRAFFTNNPDEEITHKDIALKLDLTVKQTYSLIQKLKEEGLCESYCVIRGVKP
jgi:predicted transcriptional regulator